MLFRSPKKITNGADDSSDPPDCMTTVTIWPQKYLKIWIDILTPKQLLFSEPIIEKLGQKHEILSTSREYNEVSKLAKISARSTRKNYKKSNNCCLERRDYRFFQVEEGSFKPFELETSFPGFEGVFENDERAESSQEISLKDTLHYQFDRDIADQEEFVDYSLTIKASLLKHEITILY